jgi:hypothetical protein
MEYAYGSKEQRSKPDVVEHQGSNGKGFGFMIVKLDAGADDSEEAQGLQGSPSKPASEAMFVEDKRDRLEK